MPCQRELDLNQIYRLSDPMEAEPVRARIDFDSGDMRRRIIRGEQLLDEALQAHQENGTAFEDILWLTHPGVPLVHERVLDVLRHFGITGWATYPVEVFDSAGLHLPGYHGLVITGRCGPIFTDRTVLVWRTHPGGMYPYYRGRYFDLQQWDGSDIFTGDLGITIYVTERVRDLLQQHGVSNAEFSRITEIEADKALADRLWKERTSDSS